MPEINKEINDATTECMTDDEKLKITIGGDFSDKKTLLQRGEYISILLQKFHEISNTTETDQKD